MRGIARCHQSAHHRDRYGEHVYTHVYTMPPGLRPNQAACLKFVCTSSL